MIATALCLLVLGSTSGSAAIVDPNSIDANRLNDLDRYAFYSKPRNVLLIIADDVGIDQLPVFTNAHNANLSTSDDLTPATTSTPSLEALADAGVTFIDAWGYATCSPTRASIYTGRHAFRTGIYSPMDVDGGGALDLSTTTIADVAEDAGRETALFGKWHLGEADDPTQYGWSEFAGVLEGHISDYLDWEKVSATAGSMPSTTEVARYATLENTDDAVAWIDAQDGPWVLTVAYNASHMTTMKAGGGWTFDGEAAPSDCTTWTGTSDMDVFRGHLECLDHYVGDLLSRIDSATLDRTTIIFVGDNGTDGAFATDFPGRAKGTLYEGGINVPLIIADGYAFRHGEANPGSTQAGRVVSPGRMSTALVQTVDLFATIAAIAGGDPGSGTDSVSLIPLLEASATSVRTVSYVTDGTREGVTSREALAPLTPTRRYKLLRNIGTGSCELYELSSDRWEKGASLLAGTPTLLSRTMRDRLLSHLAGIRGSKSLTCK